MSENADVKIKLVVDDGETKSAAAGVKHDLQDVAEHADKAKQHGKGFSGELLKAELYTHLIVQGTGLVAEGLHQAFEVSEKLTDSAMETADEMNQQVRTMTGLMTFMDRGAHSMQDIRGYASGIREELAQAGTQAGVTTAKMAELYDTVIERGARSTEEAKELVSDMALVGKVVPRGMEGLAEGFNMMELGIVRARNPLVQLIASTGVLKGNAHDIAKAMQHMTPAHQIELAQKAISMQAASLRQGGAGGIGMPTLEELKASFGNIREGFLEAVGQPMLDRVVPPLTKLRDYLAEHSEEIAHYGEEVGQSLGDAVAKVEGMIGDVTKGAKRDWAVIAADFREAEQDWNDAWGVAVGSGHDIHKDLTDAAHTFADAIKDASKYLTATVETVRNMKDLFASWNPQNGLLDGLGKWGQGVARERAKMAADQLSESAKAKDVRLGGPGEGGKEQGSNLAAGQVEFEKSIAKYQGWAKEAGQSEADIDKFVQAQREYHDAELRDLQSFADKVESSNVDGIASQIQKARDVQDDAWLGSALNYIGESDSMTKALMDGSIHVQGGFDALKEVIARSAPELAERIKKMQKEAFGPKGIQGQGPQMNFYGGIHIKQDFRDQDPDRIVQVFRRDLVEQSVNRRQARTGMFAGL